MSLSLKRILTVAAGLLVAGVMLLLGLWQMSSYQTSMTDVSAERAAQPPLDLVDQIRSDGTLEDIYGRRVTIKGRFAGHQVAVGTSFPLRQVIALTLEDGRTLPVVLGEIGRDRQPPDPAGVHELTGIFTAGDQSSTEAVPHGAPAGALPTLRLQTLVQTWPQPMVPGYVTLLPKDAERFGLAPATARLPEGQGSAMHRGYALQWWVFAGASVAASIVIARGYRDPRRRPARARSRR